LDLAQAHVHGIAVHDDVAGEAAVHAVVAQQVGVGVHRTQVVDRHHLDVAARMLDDRAKNQAADAAKPFDGDANSHEKVFLSDELGAVLRAEPSKSSASVPRTGAA